MKKLWEDILHDVVQKEDSLQEYQSANFQNKDIPRSKQNSKRRSLYKSSKSIKKTTYLLGESFPNIYFTQREVDCLKLLIQGNTINSIGEKLDL
jgi:DNA-binding NarL/FixJ family response regulator